MPGRSIIVNLLLCAMIGACPLICADDDALANADPVATGSIDSRPALSHHHDHPPEECPICPGDHTCVCQGGVPFRTAASVVVTCDVALPVFHLDLGVTLSSTVTTAGVDQPPEMDLSLFGRHVALLI